MRRARIAEFRNQVPLGSAQRVIAVDGEQRYLGMLIVAEPIASNRRKPARCFRGPSSRTRFWCRQ